MSSGSNPPFVQSGVVTIAASTTSAAAPLPGGGDGTLVVTNNATGLAWITVGAGAAGAAIAGTGYPVLPGTHRIIGGGAVATWVAAILTTGLGPVYVETGTGSAA